MNTGGRYALRVIRGYIQHKDTIKDSALCLRKNPPYSVTKQSTTLLNPYDSTTPLSYPHLQHAHSLYSDIRSALLRCPAVLQ
jgi:hypothetical protein